MADKPFSLQDQFLNSVRRSKLPVTLFLVKGVKLQGHITWFDAFSLLLRRDGQAQLVYKHSISTIIPGAPVADLNMPELPADRGDGRSPSLQDLFLATVARGSDDMTLFLVNGVALQGHVAAFDQFSILLERAGQVQLIYKHAVSTLQPAHPLWLGGDDAEEPGT